MWYMNFRFENYFSSSETPICGKLTLRSSVSLSFKTTGQDSPLSSRFSPHKSFNLGQKGDFFIIIIK